MIFNDTVGYRIPSSPELVNTILTIVRPHLFFLLRGRRIPDTPPSEPYTPSLNEHVSALWRNRPTSTCLYSYVDLDSNSASVWGLALGFGFQSLPNCVGFPSRDFSPTFLIWDVFTSFSWRVSFGTQVTLQCTFDWSWFSSPDRCNDINNNNELWLIVLQCVCH